MHFPGLQKVMQGIRMIIHEFKMQYPELNLLARCLGPHPTRSPSDVPPVTLQKLRTAIGDFLNVDANLVDKHHDHSPWRYSILQAIVQQGSDPEVHAPRWLCEGAPVGIACDIPSSGLFPAESIEEKLCSEEEVVHDPGSNHPSFHKTVFGLRDGPRRGSDAGDD